MMRINVGFDLIESFIVVAEELNFRRSAERLSVDQSALTRRIQRLEESIGFRLLERTTRGVNLTPAGKQYLNDNIRLLDQHAHSVAQARRVAEGQSGYLRIGYMSFAASELMPYSVAQYKDKHDNVAITMHYINTKAQKLALARDEIDIGFLIGPFKHADFHTLIVSSDPLYVIMPLNHPLAKKQEILPKELIGYSLILGDVQNWDEYRWRLMHMFSAEGVDLDISIEASTTSALLGLVSAGLGVTIYPKSLTDFTGTSVNVCPLKSDNMHIETVLAWKRLNRTEHVREFVNAVKTSIKKRA